MTSPKQRNDPDFPLRGYVRCETCGKPLTGELVEGTQRLLRVLPLPSGRCRAVNISKAKLEELFVDELARLQPTAGFMRLVKDRVLHAWRELKADRQATDRRDRAPAESDSREAGPFGSRRSCSSGRSTSTRTTATATSCARSSRSSQMDRHSSELEEMDVEGILAFAERVLPSASNLWVQSSLAQKQRLQQVFFPEGVRFDGKRLVGTGVTLPVFNYLSPFRARKKIWWTRPGSNR